MLVKALLLFITTNKAGFLFEQEKPLQKTRQLQIKEHYDVFENRENNYHVPAFQIRKKRALTRKCLISNKKIVGTLKSSPLRFYR